MHWCYWSMDDDDEIDFHAYQNECVLFICISNDVYLLCPRTWFVVTMSLNALILFNALLIKFELTNNYLK